MSEHDEPFVAVPGWFTDRTGTDERQAGLRDDPCTFVPAHEPWSCAVHRGGHRTSLDQERCNLAAPPESIVANGRLYILSDLAGKFADLAEQSRGPQREALTVERLAEVYHSYTWPSLPVDKSRPRHLAEFVVAHVARDLGAEPAQDESYGPVFVGFDQGHDDSTVVVGAAWHSTRVLSLTTDELDMLLAICEEGIEDWDDQTAVGLRAKVLALGAQKETDHD